MLISPNPVCWFDDNQVLPLKDYINYNKEIDKSYLLDKLVDIEDSLLEFEDTKEQLKVIKEDKEKALTWLKQWFALSNEEKLTPKSLDILKTVQAMLEE